jgi:LuxR family transcriptional regulator, maltose regulon positive regulatory protein
VLASKAPPRRRSVEQAAFEAIPSKLMIPVQRPGVVHRTALVNRLRSARSARVVSIAAPAGYGKSTLLAQWAARDQRPFAWVSVDHRDNDPIMLLTHVAAALDGVEPLHRGVYRSLAAGGASIWATSIPRLGGALGAVQTPLVLVLDDVHELHERDCLDALAVLSEHVPDGSQLVLSGRSEAAVPIARIRTEGRLFELGSHELALSDAEAHALLRATDLDVDEDDARALNARTEGWAAGLYLAALSLSSGSTAPSSAASFAGDDRFVTDYFRSEHLSHMSRAQLQFLTRTAVLHRMNGALCDAVLERSDSARMLDSLESANHFVVPLDHHRDWYRYHHLFRDMLRSELARREPELVPELNRRAGAWCAEHGMPDWAIEYAAAADDLDTVAELVGQHLFSFYGTGRVATVERWLGTFDDPELLLRYPAVATLGTWIHALRGRPDDAERWAHAVEISEYDGPMPDGTPSLEPWAAMVRALLCRHGVERMRADSEAAAKDLSPSSPWCPIALLLQGVGTLLSGEAGEAKAILAKAGEQAASSGAVYAGVVAHSELALLALERDDIDAAQGHALEARCFVGDEQIGDYLPTALLLAVSARVAIRRGAGPQARHDLTLAQRLRPQLTHAVSWFAVQSQIELAAAHLALEDPHGAMTLVREAEQVLRRRPSLGTLARRAEQLRRELAVSSGPSEGWASTLTTAELRLLPLLTTHFSFREIAERLFVSRNTVKTQAISVYRKLGASSRSEAVARAIQLGLVEAPRAGRAVPAEFPTSPPRGDVSGRRSASNTEEDCGRLSSDPAQACPSGR